MLGIICAIRGGPASQPTISKSIQIAIDTGETIYFLYVVNLDFLTHSSSSKTDQVSQEIKEMGEFILIDAQERAAGEGVTAEGEIRDGVVIDEILEFCREIDPEYVILGRPREEKENNLLSNDRLQKTIARITDVCRATVVLASDDPEQPV